MKDEVEPPIEQNGKREIEQIIKQIPLDCYPGTMIGVEKESLRIGRDGYISHAPHPYILGSSLTHPCITTDFSEINNLESNMRISFFLTTILYILMAYSTSSYGDGLPQVPKDYPSHKALGKCYTTQQINEIRQQLDEYNVTRVRVSSVLRLMADKYKLSAGTRLRLQGFAENFERMEKNLPDPDPDSDEFRNFDFQLGLSFTALTVFLNTNNETAAQFSDDRNNTNSDLGIYLSELDSSRKIYMSSLKPASRQQGSNPECNNKF